MLGAREVTKGIYSKTCNKCNSNVYFSILIFFSYSQFMHLQSYYFKMNTINNVIHYILYIRK